MIQHIELHKDSPGDFTQAVFRALDLEDVFLYSNSFPGSAPYSASGNYDNWEITASYEHPPFQNSVEKVKFFNHSKGPIKSVSFSNALQSGRPALAIEIQYKTKKGGNHCYHIIEIEKVAMFFGVVSDRLSSPVFPPALALLNEVLTTRECPLPVAMKTFLDNVKR